jgi:hypothetical protein
MISIMQPYYLPFIGYFQLINKVDKFVIFNDIKFEKSGFLTSNKIKNTNLILFIKNRNKVSTIQEKFLASEMKDYINKLRKNLMQNYALFNKDIFDKLFQIPEDFNYFNFIFSQIKYVCKLLDIKTELLISSKVVDTINLKSHEKIFAICKKVNDMDYFNPISGRKLYDKKLDLFKKNNINLNYFSYHPYINEHKDDFSILHLLFTYKISEIKRSLLV